MASNLAAEPLAAAAAVVEKSLRAGAPPSEEALELLEDRLDELRPHLEHSEAAEALDRLADHMDSFDLDKAADGNGDGVLAVGEELTWDADKNQITAENYGISPVKLVNIRKEH